jgi:hypothetical protein
MIEAGRKLADDWRAEAARWPTVYWLRAALFTLIRHDFESIAQGKEATPGL